MGAALHFVGVLEGNYGVGAVGDGRAGHDANDATGGYRDIRQFACGNRARDFEGYRVVGGCSMNIGCPKRVAVHRGVVQRRDVVGCEGVLFEHLSDCFEQGRLLGFQRPEVAQDAL